MLAEIRDYLKTLNIADYYTIGKIDNAKERAIGVYGDGYLGRVEAFGKNSSYDITGIRILYHGTKNLKETEQVARSLYESLRYITDIDMSSIHIQYLDLNYSEPVFLGTDSNGVYEYVISGVIYYRRTESEDNE